MKCFYHNDLDGWCAGHVVSRFLDKRSKPDPEDYIEIRYGDAFPFDIIKPAEKIYIVDFSLEKEDMDKLLDITEDVVWIDHHQTAIEKYADFPREIKGVRKDGVSGCVLTYLWFISNCEHGMGISGNQNAVPWPIRYVGDRDTWQWKFGEKTLHFCSGSELYNLDPLSPDWAIIFKDYNKVIEQGKTVEQYKQQRNKEYFKQFGYVAEFEGYKAAVVNCGLVDSKIFGDLLSKNYDIGIMYVEDGDKLKVSLRSERIDVSKIAVKYGGGGHQGASGFEWYFEGEDKFYPWVVIPEEE